MILKFVWCPGTQNPSIEAIIVFAVNYEPFKDQIVIKT